MGRASYFAESSGFNKLEVVPKNRGRGTQEQRAANRKARQFALR